MCAINYKYQCLPVKLWYQKPDAPTCQAWQVNVQVSREHAYGPPRTHEFMHKHALLEFYAGSRRGLHHQLSSFPCLLPMGSWRPRTPGVHCRVVTWNRLIHSCLSWRKGEKSSSACQVCLKPCCWVTRIVIPEIDEHRCCWHPPRQCGPRLVAVSC